MRGQQTWLLSVLKYYKLVFGSKYNSYTTQTLLHTHSTILIVSKMLSASILIALLVPALSSAQIIKDPGVYGPPLEVVHLYNDQWPTGSAVYVL